MLLFAQKLFCRQNRALSKVTLLVPAFSVSPINDIVLTSWCPRAKEQAGDYLSIPTS